MTKFGYARVSSTDQDLALQKATLTSAGCEIVRAEKVSGKSRSGRDELANLLEFIRKDDELVVVKLDRLGRSTRDVLNIVHELESKGASLRILQPDTVSTAGPMGKVAITILGMVAELERNFIRERQQEGIADKKAADKKMPASQRTYKGRPKAVSVETIAALAAEGLGPTTIAKRVGVTRMTVYRHLKGAARAADLADSGASGD